MGVVTTQMGNGDNIDQILQYAQAAHVSFDEFAFAPYFDVGPDGRGTDTGSSYQASLNAVTKKLDADQVCDMADMYVQYRCFTNIAMPENIEALKRNNFQGKLVCYEGGAEGAQLGGMDPTQQDKISHGWANNPRMGPWIRYYLQRMQDNYGISLFCYYTLNHSALRGWGIYTHWDQVDGRGDGTDGLFNNLNDLQSPKCVSVKGYWIHDWLDQLDKKSVQRNPGSPSDL